MNGIWLFILLAVAIPIWVSRSAGNRLKRRLAQKAAPVPARSTTVVVNNAEPMPQSRPLSLDAINIRTAHCRRRFTSDGASGWGLDPHAQDMTDAHAHGHGDGDGV